MLKLRVDYSSSEEKDKLLEAIKGRFKEIDIRKDPKREKGPVRRLYVNAEVGNGTI